MKKILLSLLLVSAVFISCEKEKENNCPTLTAAQVPSEVTGAFATKYPGQTVETWFNKDNNGFCALFKMNGKETRAFFDLNGNFQKEEVEGDHNNDHNDDNGCDCENDD